MHTSMYPSVWELGERSSCRISAAIDAKLGRSLALPTKHEPNELDYTSN